MGSAVEARVEPRYEEGTAGLHILEQDFGTPRFDYGGSGYDERFLGSYSPR